MIATHWLHAEPVSIVSRYNDTCVIMFANKSVGGCEAGQLVPIHVDIPHVALMSLGAARMEIERLRLVIRMAKDELDSYDEAGAHLTLTTECKKWPT